MRTFRTALLCLVGCCGSDRDGVCTDRPRRPAWCRWPWSRATPESGAAPLEVQFSSAGSTDPDGTIASYSWDFGDGSPLETTADATHTYAAAGTYTATLTVTDNSNLTKIGLDPDRRSSRSTSRRSPPSWPPPRAAACR